MKVERFKKLFLVLLLLIFPLHAALWFQGDKVDPRFFDETRPSGLDLEALADDAKEQRKLYGKIEGFAAAVDKIRRWKADDKNQDKIEDLREDFRELDISSEQFDKIPAKDEEEEE